MGTTKHNHDLHVFDYILWEFNNNNNNNVIIQGIKLNIYI